MTAQFHDHTCSFDGVNPVDLCPARSLPRGPARNWVCRINTESTHLMHLPEDKAAEKYMRSIKNTDGEFISY